MVTTVSVVVTEIPQDAPPKFGAWLSRRLDAVPRKGGVTLRDGQDEAVFPTWQAADHRMWAKIKMLRAQAADCCVDGHTTATADYLLDNAKRWSIMRALVQTHRFRLWPTEVDDAS